MCIYFLKNTTYSVTCIENNRNFAHCICAVFCINWGAGMAQWWEHSPPTNVSRVWFPDLASYVGWVCCWFSSLLGEVFLRVPRFSPLLKNQHFQIRIQSGIVKHFVMSLWLRSLRKYSPYLTLNLHLQICIYIFLPSLLMHVQYCRTDTTRKWLDTTRTTRTGHETMVYGSYRSWNNPVEQTMVTCISLVRQRFNQDSTTRTTRTTRTGRETMVHESYNWWTA